MNLTSRLPSLFIAVVATTLAAAPARAQGVAPEAPGEVPSPAAAQPEANPPPADVDAPPAASPGQYGPPPSYGAPANPAYPPAYPPPPVYPPPGYGPRPAYPPPPYGPPGYNPGPPENVHDGFFLRLHVGGGFTSISGSDGAGNKVKISGGSLSLGVTLGGALAENLILFGNFFMSIADRPTVEQLGVSVTSSGSAALGGFGIGLTYYFMPVNVYVSGALAGMAFSMSDANGNDVYSTDTGVGFQGMIGKEWWVSSEWGLGVAGEFIVASMKDKDNSSIKWSGSAFSLLFSSTFN